MLLDNYIKSYNQNLLSFRSGNGYINNLDDSYKLSDGTSIKLGANQFGGVNPLIQPPNSYGYVNTTIPSTSTSDPGYRYIVFGDGNTPVSLNDYTISGNVVPNIRCTSITGGMTSEGVLQTYVFNSNNSTEVTIKEVCMFGSWGGSSSFTYKLALWREVFDTPLVVPAGSTFLYNMNVVWSI